MLGQEMAEFVRRLALEGDVLTRPPILVERSFLVLAVLPLVTNGNLWVTLHDLQGPRVEIFFHDARGLSGSLAVGFKRSGRVITVGYGAG